MDILQIVVIGILVGGVYGLIAIGLTLVFGVIKIINFAHGEFLMAAMYLSYSLALFLGINPYALIPVIAAFLFLFGVLTFLILIKPVLNDPENNQILLTMGLSVFMQNMALIFFGSDVKKLSLAMSYKSIMLGPIFIDLPRVLAFFSSIGLIFVLFLLIKRTSLGRSIRAVADNREAAVLMGLNVTRIYLIAFGLGIACLGLAGPLIIPFYPTYPVVGLPFAIKSFIIVVMGTLGSLGGALVGGLIIGVAESLGNFLLPGSMGPVAIYIIFILILLFKPEGLFAGKT